MDPIGNDLPVDKNGIDRDLDAIDLQPDILSQILQNSLPAETLDQGSSFTDPDPDSIPDLDEGNDLASHYLRQQEDNLFPTHVRQVSPALDSARIRHPPAAWGRVAGNGDVGVKDEIFDSDSDPNLSRLAKLYEALLTANRI